MHAYEQNYTHSTNLRVPDKPMKINIWEWNSPSKLNSHHYHPCHPKKQNVMPVPTTETSVNGSNLQVTDKPMEEEIWKQWKGKQWQ